MSLLTGLIPDIHRAMNRVSREAVGLIPAVSIDNDVARITAVGQEVVSHVSSKGSPIDIVAGMNPPDTGDKSYGTHKMTIDKSRGDYIRFKGEQSLAIASGIGQASLFEDDLVESMRALSGEIEADLAGLHTQFSRAHGTAGTTPFATNLGDPAQVRKILIDNGAPETDLQLSINTAAGANLRTLANLNSADQAGSDATLRRGVLLPIHNLDIRESAGIKTHIKGTGAGYLINNVAGYSTDETDLAVDTGAGTILAGDVVTLAGDINKYIVGTDLAAGALAINKPGLQLATVNNAAMTVGDSYTANMAFHRGAIRLATRAPALVGGEDSAVDRYMITDPISGLSFEVSVYMQFKQVLIEVAIAWGVSVVKPEHCVLLLG